LKITEVRTRPLLVPYTSPYHWAQGVIDGAMVILVEVDTDEGLTGYGESIGTPSTEGIQSYIKLAGANCVNRSPFENAQLMAEAYHGLFQALGTCSSPRFGGQVLAGLEMALWDLMGKATGLAAHELMGGAVRNEIQYFGFAQGETAQEIAAEAKLLAESGCEVIYFKVGRGDALDIAIAQQVRAAIGPQKRLRMDPNEHWSPVRAARLIRKMCEFDVEFIEQPTNCESVAALAQVRANSLLLYWACMKPAVCCGSAKLHILQRQPESTFASMGFTKPASPPVPRTRWQRHYPILMTAISI
jgi:muconate cycloisomerase